jgi:hypothetical protein
MIALATSGDELAPRIFTSALFQHQGWSKDISHVIAFLSERCMLLCFHVITLEVAIHV